MIISEDIEYTRSGVTLVPNTILHSRYRIVRKLGAGGMGAVYEAIDLRLGHTVAVKQTLTEDEELWKQFEREARLMARLNHPVLPRVSDYFTEQHRAFFVMQFIEGRNLAEIIAQQPGPLPQRSVVAWADQLLDALIYLHSNERQIIHRDIKPHNLKVTSRGKIALLDFGLAKSQSTSVADPELGDSVFGYSPRYAPLEQIQNLGTGPYSDIYALGATLYHLLTGVKPPDALTRATAFICSRQNPLAPAHELNHSIGRELSAILSRAMEQNPHERYRSALEFRDALRSVGRTDLDESPEFVAHAAPDQVTVAEGSKAILVAVRQDESTARLNSRRAALILILLIAVFGVFCRYYPWKFPAQALEGSALNSDSKGEVTHVNSAMRRKKQR